MMTIVKFNFIIFFKLIKLKIRVNKIKIPRLSRGIFITVYSS